MTTSSPDNSSPEHPERRLYGRRRGKPLRPNRQTVYDERLPELLIDLPADETPLDPASLFDRPKNAFWLEVGFGKGEHLCWQAAHHPEVGCMGVEPFLNGLAACIDQLDQDQMLEKVRTSQTEILMINKNLAANLKKQRGEIAELLNKAALQNTIIESLLVQAVSVE